jgi:hypothetical protein
MRLSRPNQFNLQRRPSHLKAVMAAAAMETAPVANQVTVVRKAVEMGVVMAVALAARDVDVADAVDAAVQTARVVHNANASTQKANRCSPMSICRAQMPVHKKPHARSNVLTVVHDPNAVNARNVATAQAVVASETKVVNAVSPVRKAALKMHRHSTATRRGATTKAKPVSPVKAGVVVVAMVAAPARTVMHAMQTARAVSLNWDLWRAKPRRARHQQTSKCLPMTAMRLQHHATRTASHARSAAVTATAVNVAHVASAKSALTCASRLNPLPRQLAKVKSLPLQCRHQHHAWLSPSSLLLQHPLRPQPLLRLPHSLAHACQR